MKLDWKNIDSGRLSGYPAWLLLEQVQDVECGVNGYGIVIEIIKRFAADKWVPTEQERRETIGKINRGEL